MAIISAVILLISTKADVSFWDIVRICCYMIAPALFFIFIAIMIPLKIPLIWFICFVIFTTYSNLVFTKLRLLGTKNIGNKKEEEIEEDDDYED